MHHLRILFLLIVLVLSRITGQSQGIEFFHGTWEEALLKAKAEDKLIFVDAFATWCGPCKRMAASTFPDPEVGALFNQYFLSMKIDMEQGMGLEFRKKFPVNAYPTLFFIDQDQKVIQQSVGAKIPADLITMAQNIINKYDRSTKYEAAYKAGDRSYDLVYNYVAALNKSGKPSVKIANDYLATQTDLTTPENLKFILEAASQVDCQCFDLFETYKPQISKVVDETVIEARVRAACENTVKRAITYETPELIELAADAMKRHIPGEADCFKSKSELQYALRQHQLEKISDQVNYYTKKCLKGDPAGLNQLALDLDKYAGDDSTSIALALVIAEKATKEKEATSDCYSTYAYLTLKAKGKDEAVKILDDALLKFTDPQSKDNQQLTALRNRFQNM